MAFDADEPDGSYAVTPVYASPQHVGAIAGYAIQRPDGSLVTLTGNNNAINIEVGQTETDAHKMAIEDDIQDYRIVPLYIAG
jgi:hypothetical protein